MTKLLLIALLLLPTLVSGQESKPPTLLQFAQDALKNSEGGTALNLSGDRLAAPYVPLRTLNWPLTNIFDGGFGAIAGDKIQVADALVSARLNLPQLANGLFGTSWFQKHTHGLTLPTLFIGPAIKAAWPMSEFTWKKNTMFLIGIPFGSIGI